MIKQINKQFLLNSSHHWVAFVILWSPSNLKHLHTCFHPCWFWILMLIHLPFLSVSRRMYQPLVHGGTKGFSGDCNTNTDESAHIKVPLKMYWQWKVSMMSFHTRNAIDITIHLLFTFLTSKVKAKCMYLLAVTCLHFPDKRLIIYVKLAMPASFIYDHEYYLSRPHINIYFPCLTSTLNQCLRKQVEWSIWLLSFKCMFYLLNVFLAHLLVHRTGDGAIEVVRYRILLHVK